MHAHQQPHGVGLLVLLYVRKASSKPGNGLTEMWLLAQKNLRWILRVGKRLNFKMLLSVFQKLRKRGAKAKKTQCVFLAFAIPSLSFCMVFFSFCISWGTIHHPKGTFVRIFLVREVGGVWICSFHDPCLIAH